MRFLTLALTLGIAGSSILAVTPAAAESVNLYSSRKEALMRPLLDAFTEETGAEVRIVAASGGQLIQRMIAEGEYSPADVLLTVDAGNLWRAANAGMLQPVDSEYLLSVVPSDYRDPGNQWFGLSLRARAVVYATDRVSPDSIATDLGGYIGLAAPVWEGRVAVRSSGNIYNQSLIAAVIANFGAERAEQWARGVVGNLARPPSGGDRDQIRAVAAGEADVAIVNSYYYALMLGSEESDSIDNTAIYFPTDDQMGTHVNVSGAGVARHAPHPELALAFIEFLASPEAQSLYASINNEFPVHPDVQPSGQVAKWESFTPDDVPVVEFGKLNADAVRTADRAGWK